MYKIKKALDFGLSLGEKYVLTKLFEIMRIEKRELYIVGGAVRNALLNKEPKDIDLCTDATPKEIISIIKEYDIYDEYEIIETGLKHGTITLYSRKYNCSFEITTFRVDGAYEDHRRPDNVTFTRSLEEDLKRRDLTINSFAYDFYHKELLMLDEDYLYDLDLGIIRTVGNPEDRFNEDALRMLRAIRFAAQFGFTIEEETFESIKKLSSTLEFISKERIRDELTKILLSDHPEMLDYLYLTGLDTYTLSFLTMLLETKQHNIHHYTDVLHHTYDVIRSLPKDFCLRWAALLHDVGKPVVEETDEKGYNHYIGHPEHSAYFAKQLMQELKFDNKSINEIYTLVLYHDSEIGDIKISKFKKLIVEIGPDLFEKFLALRYADAMAHKLYGSDIKDIKFIKAISKAKERYKQILKEKCALTIKDLVVDGNDMLALGYKGKEIGKHLKLVLDWILEEIYPNDKTIILQALNELKLLENKTIKENENVI